MSQSQARSPFESLNQNVWWNIASSLPHSVSVWWLTELSPTSGLCLHCLHSTRGLRQLWPGSVPATLPYLSHCHGNPPRLSSLLAAHCHIATDCPRTDYHWIVPESLFAFLGVKQDKFWKLQQIKINIIKKRMVFLMFFSLHYRIRKIISTIHILAEFNRLNLDMSRPPTSTYCVVAVTLTWKKTCDVWNFEIIHDSFENCETSEL